MEPRTTVELMVDLGVTSNVFLAGHRIRVEISSSNYPRYDRSFNGGDAVNPRVAVNTIFHGPAHRSRLTLPVIDPDR